MPIQQIAVADISEHNLSYNNIHFYDKDVFTFFRTHRQRPRIRENVRPLPFCLYYIVRVAPQCPPYRIYSTNTLTSAFTIF